MAEFCTECGATAVEERIGPVTHKINRREVMVADERHLSCAKCGNISYRGNMLGDSHRAVAEQIRREDGLLTPDELRVVRLKYGFTQADMERLLTIGPKTWVRWERGKVVQSSTADQMIRQIAKNPDVLRDLMATTGVKNAKAEDLLSAYDRALAERLSARLRERMPGVEAAILNEAVQEAVHEIQRVRHEAVDAVTERQVA